MTFKKIPVIILSICCILTLSFVNVHAEEAEDEGGVTPLDIAELAVKYSWSSRAESVGNKGTELYQQLHDLAFPGDPYYASCDRSATTAIVASGADPNFPPGPCQTIVSYCENSPLWTYIGDSSTVAYSNLQPGDLFVIGSYHTMLYVGYEVGGHGDTVEGSISRVWSPAIVDTIDKLYQRGGVEYVGQPYRIYRMTGFGTGELLESNIPEEPVNEINTQEKPESTTEETVEKEENAEDADKTKSTKKKSTKKKTKVVETTTDRVLEDENKNTSDKVETKDKVSSNKSTTVIEKRKVEVEKTTEHKAFDMMTVLFVLTGIGA